MSSVRYPRESATGDQIVANVWLDMLDGTLERIHWPDPDSLTDHIRILVLAKRPNAARELTQLRERLRNGNGPEQTVNDLLQMSGVAELNDASSGEDVEAAFRRLSMAIDGAPQGRRVDARREAIRVGRKFGWRAREVEDLLSLSAGDGDGFNQGSGLTLTDPEPWHERVDGATLLTTLAALFSLHLSLPQGAATALALWTVFTYVHDAAAVSPLLAITSATMRSGKSTLVILLGALVRRPISVSNITTAALYRAVEKFRPTLLIDEGDTFLREQNELRGILNSGHTRATAVVIRSVGDDHDARTFSTWSPKAIAMIGRLPDTLTDRAIEIRLRRRAKHENVERLRQDRLQQHEPLRRRAARWAADNIDVLRKSDPEVPSYLNDRAADNWRALFAIADAAGGEWPARAREAARHLCGGATAEVEGDYLVQLLADLCALFGDTRTSMTSEEIVSALGRMEDRPWPEWKRGRPISTKQLANLLARFGVRPVKLNSSRRGYKLEDFDDSFTRYLPPTDAEVGDQQLVPDSSGTDRIKESAESRSRYSQLPVFPDQHGRSEAERILLGEDA